MWQKDMGKGKCGRKIWVKGNSVQKYMGKGKCGRKTKKMRCIQLDKRQLECTREQSKGVHRGKELALRYEGGTGGGGGEGVA